MTHRACLLDEPIMRTGRRDERVEMTYERRSILPMPAQSPPATWHEKGAAMTLDDVYGPDCERFPLEQEILRHPGKLDWEDDADAAEGLPPAQVSE